MTTTGKLQRRNKNETVSNIATILVVCVAALAPMRRDSRAVVAVTSARRRRDKNPLEKPLPLPLPALPLETWPLVLAPLATIKRVVAAAGLGLGPVDDGGLCLIVVSNPRRPRMMQMLQTSKMRLGIMRTVITAGRQKKGKG